MTDIERVVCIPHIQVEVILELVVKYLKGKPALKP